MSVDGQLTISCAQVSGSFRSNIIVNIHTQTSKWIRRIIGRRAIKLSSMCDYNSCTNCFRMTSSLPLHHDTTEKQHIPVNSANSSLNTFSGFDLDLFIPKPNLSSVKIVVPAGKTRYWSEAFYFANNSTQKLNLHNWWHTESRLKGIVN